MGLKCHQRRVSIRCMVFFIALAYLLYIFMLHTLDNTSPKHHFAPREPWLHAKNSSVNSRNSFKSSLALKELRNRLPQIPHSIHQVWFSSEIPRVTVPWITQWITLHPNWEYRFWTLDQVRMLIQEHYPRNLQLFDSLSSWQKLEASRIFIMHRFGGIHLDIDMEPLKPLHNWTFNYKCVLSQDHPAHMFVLRHRNKPSLISDVMMCIANHDFFRTAIDLLQTKVGGNLASEEEPSFLTQAFSVFTKNSSSHLQGWQVNASLTVVPSKYFSPNLDLARLGDIIEKCNPIHIWQLVPQGQIICHSMMKQNFRQGVFKESFANHHWMYKRIVSQQMMSIHKVINDASLLKKV